MFCDDNKTFYIVFVLPVYHILINSVDDSIVLYKPSKYLITKCGHDFVEKQFTILSVLLIAWVQHSKTSYLLNV